MLPETGLNCDSRPLSSQYGRSVTTSLCQCGRRYECYECREYWVRRRCRSSEAWLRDAIGDDGKVWFVLSTLPVSGDWPTETTELFRRWSLLGKRRSQQRFRASQQGLGSIRRGIASLHLVGSRGRYQPHLHAVIVADPTMGTQALIEAWQTMGQGYVDAQRADSLGAVVRYAVAGPLPSDPIERASLGETLRGVRVIRRVGR